MGKTVVKSYSLPLGLKEEIANIASKKNTTQSRIVSDAIIRYLEQENPNKSVDTSEEIEKVDQEVGWAVNNFDKMEHEKGDRINNPAEKKKDLVGLGPVVLGSALLIGLRFLQQNRE